MNTQTTLLQEAQQVMTTQQPEALRLADYLEQDESLTSSCNGAAAELRRLHEESELHLQELRSYRFTVENREARIAELEAQLAAAQQDAARYRALCSSGAYAPSSFRTAPWGLVTGNTRSQSKAALDAAVDTYIATQAKQGEQA